MTLNKSYKMKHVEKMTRLVGTIATQIVYNEEPKPSFNYNPVYYFDAFLTMTRLHQQLLHIH